MPPTEPDSAPTPPPVPFPGADAPPPRPRFCSACGLSLTDLNAPCPACTARGSRPKLISAGDAVVSLKGALGLYFALLIVILAFALVSAALGEGATPNDLALTSFAADILLSLVVLVASIPAYRHLRPALAYLGPPRYYALAPIMGLITFTIATFVVRATTSLFNFTDPGYANEYLEAGYSWFIPVLAVAVQPAIFEEIAFRGIIGSTLERVLGSRDALIVTALLFATLHLSPAAFPHLFLMGLALGWLRRKSGSLYPCMLLHFCHNGFVLVAEYYGI